MPRYRYELLSGAGPEHLGFIEINSDSEAIAFGREVIIDIVQEPDLALRPVSLEITDGGGGSTAFRCNSQSVAKTTAKSASPRRGGAAPARSAARRQWRPSGTRLR